MAGKRMIFWLYVLVGACYPILRVISYLCIVQESINCTRGYWYEIHFGLHYKPQYIVPLFLFLLTGLIFLRRKRIIIYLGVLVINVMAFVFLPIPLPW